MSAAPSERSAHPVEAVVFDLDGTLVDSEPNYREVDARFLLERGILLDDGEWDEVVGMGGGPFIDYLRRRHGIEGSTDDLIAEKDDLYLDYAVGRTRAFPRMVEFLRYLYVHGYPIAVATSSRRRVLDTLLEDVGLGAYVGVTVAGDEIRHPKPEPDIFIEAARRLDVAPERCLVLEDSQYGVVAASRAGMAVVALPAPGQETMERIVRADMVVAGGPARLEVGALVERYGLSRFSVADAPPDRAALSRFRSVVWEYYDAASRPMPWRETDDPYRIMVSEFMLQQTQVVRVEPRYRAFVERFPDVASLAAASLHEVLGLWQGLGYNRRGRNLLEAARAVVDRHGGQVPADHSELQALPGVGPYTSAAICAFAYERPVVVLETNIRRLFLHFFGANRDGVRDREIEPLIAAALPPPGARGSVRHWYYALMDYGAALGRLFRNANRRSAHYTRQSAFVGSVREVRGRIIRALSVSGSATIRELEQKIGPTDSRLVPAIEGLERDGMVVSEGESIRLA